MNQKLVSQSFLEKTDEALFREGACHIFAVALQQYFPDEKYELCRAALAASLVHTAAPGFHVFCVSSDFAIDVCGVCEIDALRKRLTEGATHILDGNDFVPETRVEPQFSYHPTSAAELLDRGYAKTGEPANRFRLFTSEQFVATAMHRARSLIEASPVRFSIGGYRTKRV